MAYTTQDYIDAIKQDKEQIRQNLNTKLGMDIPEGANFTDIADRTGTYVPSINLQDKKIEITENGVETIEADEGYDRLESVEITTNVSGGGEIPDYTIDTFTSTSSTSISTNFLNYLTTLPPDFVKQLNQKNITSFYNGFAYLKNIKHLDLKHLDISKSVSLGLVQMFTNNSSLESIDLTGWVIPANVTNMSSFLRECPNLTEIDLSSWTFVNNKINTFSYFFLQDSLLKTIKLPANFLNYATNMSSFLERCSSIENLDFLQNQDIKNVTNLQYFCRYCYNLKTIDLSTIDTHYCSTLDSAFAYLHISTLPENFQTVDIDLSNKDTYSLTNMSSMFYGSRNLRKINLSNLENSRVTSMNGMFSSSIYPTSSNPNTASANNVRAEINFTNFGTSAVTTMNSMFYYYFGTKLDLRSFNTSKVTNMAGMFGNTWYLEEIWMDNFDFAKVTTQFANMFTSCGVKLPSGQLTKIYVKDETAQNWILTKNNGHPTTWSTANVIIAGSDADDRNL